MHVCCVFMRESIIQYTRIQATAANRAPPLVGSLKPSKLPSCLCSISGAASQGETLNSPTVTEMMQ